jgi:zinc/manganese transport system ATP-binding protein
MIGAMTTAPPYSPRASSAPGAEPRAAAPAIYLHDGEARLGGHAIWSGLDLNVGRGEFVALLGANGAGKSTLLKALLGLLPLSAGTVSVLGAAPGEANRAIGYLPQRRAFDSSTRLRASDIVQLGLEGDRWGLPLALPWGGAGARRREARGRVRGAIEMVGASAYARRPAGELSGGEQ